ncbi:acyltransferase family protein [Asticcacaulis biprosthecium]|uniref:acyltransferase family protein n=1 Tax=Asticcacaulis biprosthecium TaxID=76891 RepID=UPI001FE24061|nr:acyltransferase [Asticcacaulis biprosthecium]
MASGSFAAALTAAAPGSSPAEIRSLTGLRGLAALYVVIFHANGFWKFPDPVRPFIHHGYMAVDLFFILSGFVMAMTYAHMFEDGFCFKKFKHFLVLRLVRIYPLFALMTVLTAILIVTVLAPTYRFEDLPLALLPNFTLTQVWGLSNSIVPQAWSISAEWAAYLLFPPGVWLALKVSRRWTVLGLLASFAVLGAIAYGPHWIAETPLRGRHGPLDIVSSYALGTTLRCLASFYIGLVAWRFKDLIPARAAGVLFLLALLLLSMKGSDLILVGVFGVLIMALSHDTGWVARLMQVRWVYWLGGISYALYLIHDIVQKIIFQSFPGWGLSGALPKWGWVIVSVTVSIALAALSHYQFEKPSRTWFRRLIKNPPASKPREVLTPAE